MLDPLGRKEVMNTIKRLNRVEGMTVVLITHYMNEAVEADKVIVMKNGSVYLEGTPNQVFSQPQKLWEAGLEVPQSIELIDKLNRELSLNIPLKVMSTEECAQIVKEAIRKNN